MTIPESALGGIIAATITSLAALLGLIISKENKTSEFRQAWIDALRADIAALIGHLNAMQGTLQIVGRSEEGWREARADVVGTNRAIASIRLRLNPTEAGPGRLLVQLNRIDSLFSKDSTASKGDITALESDIIRDSQVILKTEWNRVRNGEIVFVCARSVSFIVLIFAVAGVIAIAVG